ncbi:unnamed protein product, partial [Brenthis ino]
MGAITSKDTRRISFDNNFAISPILLQKTMEDSDDIDITDGNTPSDLDLKQPGKNTELVDDRQDYWTSRIDYLKNEHHVINKIIENEYEKTIEYTNKLFETPKVTQEKIQKLKPCFDWQAKITQCYEDNPRQPLVCSAIVQAFRNYVISCQLED